MEIDEAKDEHSSMNKGFSRKRLSDKVVLNVGGTLFTTSVLTLTSSSTYFQRMFSDEWQQGQTLNPSSNGTPEIFVDQDPEPFRTLLSFMRTGSLNSVEITAEVLKLAEFLGMEDLTSAVKCRAYQNMGYLELSDEDAIASFDKSFGSIIGGISSGILPLYITKHTQSLEYKEYAHLCVQNPRDFHFDNYDNLVVHVYAPKYLFDPHYPKDDHSEIGRVPDVCTFLDGLNWLYRLSFNKQEDDVSGASLGEHDLRAFRSIVYSRKLSRGQSTNECDELEAGSAFRNMIVDDVSEGLIMEDRKEFASIVNFIEDDGYIEADVGETCRVTVGGEEITAHISKKTIGSNDFIRGLNWLQAKGFCTREKKLEEVYKSIREKSMKFYGITQGYGLGLHLMLWSRNLPPTAPFLLSQNSQ